MIDILSPGVYTDTPISRLSKRDVDDLRNSAEFVAVIDFRLSETICVYCSGKNTKASGNCIHCHAPLEEADLLVGMTNGVKVYEVRAG